MGVLGEDLLQHLRPVMEGNAEVPDLPLRFQLQRRLIGPAAFEHGEVFHTLGVHQVEVKVVHAAGFQLALEEGANVLLLFEVEVGQLVGENITVAGIAAGQTLPQGQLAFAAQIAVGGVEVVETRLQKGVHHPAGLEYVHRAVLHGQAHCAKAKILFDPFHSRSSSFFQFNVPVFSAYSYRLTL